MNSLYTEDLTEASLQAAMEDMRRLARGPIALRPTVRWVSPDEWLEELHTQRSDKQPPGERWAASSGRKVTWRDGGVWREERQLLEPVPGGSFELLCAWLSQRAELNRQERELLDSIRRTS